MKKRGGGRAVTALLTVLILLLAAADQWVKHLVSLGGGISKPLFRDWVGFYYVSNTGAAFSSFEGKRLLLIIVTAVLVAACVWFFFFGKTRSPLALLGLSLIIAGGASNLYDRIFKGYVVDFIYVRHFATFNVADSCVCVGAVLVCLFVLLHERRAARSPSA